MFIETLCLQTILLLITVFQIKSCYIIKTVLFSFNYIEAVIVGKIKDDVHEKHILD